VSQADVCRSSTDGPASRYPSPRSTSSSTSTFAAPWISFDCPCLT
jgi:hypothetical protein